MKTYASLIYEPKGRALEYAPLACNLAVGCVHLCSYCFGPGSFKRPKEEWGKVVIKENAIERFAKDAKAYRGDPRPILFSFGTDPYGTPEQRSLMYDVLGIAAENELKIDVLTKNPMGAEQNLAMFKKIDASLGTTISFSDEPLREKWEPGAPSIASRMSGLFRAHEEGVRTWVSVEPVVDVDEAIGVIAGLAETTLVDFFKVGKWNHDVRSMGMDWPRFLETAAGLLHQTPRLFKVDLLAAAGYRQLEVSPNTWVNKQGAVIKADSRKE